MDSISPVLTEREVPAEQVVALGQKDFYPIVVARVIHPGGGFSSYTRFRFSDAERKMIAKGADLILGQPHPGAMASASLELAMPGEYPVEGQSK
jgi:hypothetical protein